MPRSAVKSGMYDQRSRASTRRRDRRQELAHQADPTDELQAWLAKNVDVSDLQELRAINPKLFLQQTGLFNVALGERLRQLAIHVEVAASWSVQPDGWLALRALYDYALRYPDQDTWLVYNSKSISALRITEVTAVRPGQDSLRRILMDAIEAGEKAVELAPQQAVTHSVLGECYYENHQHEEALRCFEAAMAADPKAGWPALYWATCLHDQERWAEAFAAYSAVPLDFFKGPQAWHVDLLKEQRAECQLRMGDREGALAAYRAILDRYEAHPGQARDLVGSSFIRVVTGPLRAELHERALALATRLERGWLLERLQEPAPSGG